jgi:4-amino-4-deoxy-L-arabinose transferase-like glycosyltransferase
MSPTWVGLVELRVDKPEIQTERRRATALLLLFVAATLMVAWSLVVPIFEAPDEPAHWHYARYIHDNHTFPIFSEKLSQANTPPLYYILIAPLASATREPAVAYKYNEDYSQVFLRFPPRFFEKATGEMERYWPIRVARFATAFISVLTVWFSYLAATEVTGNAGTGLLVGGLVAFLPQFAFRGMNVSSDALLAMFSAAAVYLMVRLVRRGFTWGIGVLAALAIAGACLSKANAAFLPLPLALTIVLEKAEGRTKLIRTGVLGVLILLILAPWLIRNQRLYGDLFARKAMYTVWAPSIRTTPIWSYSFMSRFTKFLIASFIGDFGWMNLLLRKWEYGLYGCFLVFGVLCWMRGVIRGRIDRRVSLVLLSVIALNLVTVIGVNLTIDSPQGRYMFPALTAIMLIVGLGLESLRVWSKHLTWFTVSGWALANVLILVFLVTPAYWPHALK